MRPALTALDRCDRCGAQAVAVTEHEAGELAWCGHHYDKWQPALARSLVLYEPYRDLTREGVPA